MKRYASSTMSGFQELYLYPLSGLYHECHRIDYHSLVHVSPPKADNKFCLKELNNLWWHEALSESTLSQIIGRMAARYQVIQPESPQHRAILADPKAFFSEVQLAAKNLANLGAGARAYFRALETLQIFCSVYSDFISAPIPLSLQEGLVLNELSSLLLVQEALNPVANPYLHFIERHVLPVINEVKPDLVWIVGPIKMSTFAMAMMAKKANPRCHVSVTGHATEYYSLNKITKFLKQNTVLFSVVDSIVLDDFENTEPQLAECLRAGQRIESVPNLLCLLGTTHAPRNGDHAEQLNIASRGVDLKKIGGSIVETPTLGGKQSLAFHTHGHPCSVELEDRDVNYVDPSQMVDARLWPNAKCYWDNCNFCAINRKYQTLGPSSFGNIEEVADYIASLNKRGIRYLWSFDEAIPPKSLGLLAQALLEREVKITWQTRSKVDRSFTPEICELLGRSGLREIRLGLESASTRVLSAMAKFPSGWSLNLVEQIVSQFHSAGVSVHFPTIIGFPTETEAERAETFEFLRYLINKYPSVTFNMNVLGFDVASSLYEHFEDFGITAIRFPVPAKYFLGNLVDWDCAEVPFDYYQCDQQRNAVMQELLYPWMPTTALIPPYIFYRLAETSRSTMVWKAQRNKTANWKDQRPPFIPEGTFVCTGNLVISPIRGSSKKFVYDWHTHHNFEVDEEGYILLQTLQSPSNIMDLEKKIAETFPLRTTSIGSAIEAQLEQLYDMGIVTNTIHISSFVRTDKNTETLMIK